MSPMHLAVVGSGSPYLSVKAQGLVCGGWSGWSGASAASIASVAAATAAAVAAVSAAASIAAVIGLRGLRTAYVRFLCCAPTRWRSAAVLSLS